MPSHAKRCRYCRVVITPGVKPTMDHVVPKWVLRLFPQVQRKRRFFLLNKVTTCDSCNRRKGSMPVAIFLALRLEPGNLIKTERSKWDRIAGEFAKLHYEEANAHPLASMIVAEFGRPIPQHFVLGDKRIEIRDGEAVLRTRMFLE